MTHARYPVFIPSKGRHANPLTIRMFLRDGVDFRVVVEPQEVSAYAEVAGPERVLALPESGRGLTFSRNWIKAFATAEGAARHWQFDDDIRGMTRLYRGSRVKCSSLSAIAAAEDFVDRYENVGLASFNSEFFVPATNGVTQQKWPPFYLNSRCYTVFLVSNLMPINFRGRYNEDTDMSLQVLSAGLCTILFNAFLIITPATMTATGGQTSIYVNDGRLKMSRDLQQRWPHVVETRRRFGRPQHYVKNHWRGFGVPLIPKAGAVIPEEPNEYGMELRARAPKATGAKRKASA